jgi:hypothetical protein
VPARAPLLLRRAARLLTRVHTTRRCLRSSTTSTPSSRPRTPSCARLCPAWTACPRTRPRSRSPPSSPRPAASWITSLTRTRCALPPARALPGTVGSSPLACSGPGPTAR